MGTTDTSDAHPTAQHIKMSGSYSLDADTNAAYGYNSVLTLLWKNLGQTLALERTHTDAKRLASHSPILAPTLKSVTVKITGGRLKAIDKHLADALTSIVKAGALLDELLEGRESTSATIPVMLRNLNLGLEENVPRDLMTAKATLFDVMQELV